VFAQVARVVCLLVVVWLVPAYRAFAEAGEILGVVCDETGGALPGVAVELHSDGRPRTETTTDSQGEYRFEQVEPGLWQLLFTLINVATVRREVTVTAAGRIRIDSVLHLALNADVSVARRACSRIWRTLPIRQRT